MLKIKDDVDLKKLEKFGFENAEFNENYMIKFIPVKKQNKQLESILIEFEHFIEKNKYLDTKAETQEFVVSYDILAKKLNKLKKLYCKE